MANLAASVGCEAHEDDAWAALDGSTFESWIRANVAKDEARGALRSMCRGMIAQEPAGVSLLFTVRSLKGCWSSGDDDQYRIRGGTQGPLLALAARFGGRVALDAEVVAVTASDGKWRVALRSGARVLAKYVVVTGPPAVVAKIRAPAFSAITKQLLQRMPMGASTKYFLIYDEPWWRAFHSGQVVVTDPDPATAADVYVYACEDHSPYSGLRARGPGALMCWIEGACNLRFDGLTDDERKAHVTSLFAGALKNDSRLYAPTHVVAHDWKAQPFAEGAYTSYFPPGVISEDAFWRESVTQEKAPGLFLAGSDYVAGYGAGYIEGAVRSGQAAAADILGSLLP